MKAAVTLILIFLISTFPVFLLCCKFEGWKVAATVFALTLATVSWIAFSILLVEALIGQ